MRIPTRKPSGRRGLGRLRWPLLGGFCALCLLALGAWLFSARAPALAEAPEANKILAIQANMPFQILIPAYLPKEFDRAKVETQVTQSGPGGEPMVQLVYHTAKGAMLTVREWVPVNPAMEILSASRPIETKWGKGWLLSQGTSLAVVWVDVGPLRVAVYSPSLDVLTREQLLAMAESLGPASNRQVFTFVVEKPVIKEMAPPPPVEIAVNDQGVQELTLVVTPGGYSPLRFAVRKGIPVRLTFRMLGQVGCGNELLFPANPDSPSELKLKSPQDKQVLEFTPQRAGQFQFQCSHQMYRGIMTVRE